MVRPDFRDYQGRGAEELMHSAKGTVWKNHKYIKKVGGRYIYPAKATGKEIMKTVRNTIGDISEMAEDQNLKEGDRLKKNYDRANSYLQTLKDRAKKASTPQELVYFTTAIKKQENIVARAKNELDKYESKKHLGARRRKGEENTAVPKGYRNLNTKSNATPKTYTSSILNKNQNTTTSGNLGRSSNRLQTNTSGNKRLGSTTNKKLKKKR